MVTRTQHLPPPYRTKSIFRFTAVVLRAATTSVTMGSSFRNRHYLPTTTAAFTAMGAIRPHGSSTVGSSCFLKYPSEWHNPHVPHRNTNRHKRWFHQTTALGLNRFLFDPSEINPRNKIETDGTNDPSNGVPTVTLPKSDYRTIHAAKILRLVNGDTLRAGIVRDTHTTTHTNTNTNDFTGLITDEATITWIPEGKIKKTQPTKNGEPPGSLHITLHSLGSPHPLPFSQSPPPPPQQPLPQPQPQPHVSLILALPRPLALSRLLPMISQLGLDHLVLIGAKKVPKDYFGSHLLREPMEVRRLLIEGLCQAGDVVVPKITVVKRLKPFLEDELDGLFPLRGSRSGDGGGVGYTRVIAHPQRTNDGVDCVKRLRDVVCRANHPSSKSPVQNIVLAVGPEGGWEEPYELDLFQRCGFEQITLGSRILRTDVAVVSLLGLAHDCLCEVYEDGNG